MSNNIKPLVVLTGLVSLFSVVTFAQKGKAKPVKKTVATQSADTLKPQGIYSGTAYFHGNGLKHVRSLDFSGTDLNLLMVRIDSASNGANVTIDNLRFITPTGKTTPIKKIPYQFNRAKDTAKFVSQAVQTVNKLKAYDFVSGTIYFTGFGYREVVLVNASDRKTLYQYYNRSGPGTTIILDNCVYRNANGSLSGPLNQSIKLE
jgi:hypothetical protein